MTSLLAPGAVRSPEAILAQAEQSHSSSISLYGLCSSPHQSGASAELDPDIVNASSVFRAWQWYNKCRVEGNNHPLVFGSAPAQYLWAFGARTLLAQAHLAAHLFLHRAATSQAGSACTGARSFSFPGARLCICPWISQGWTILPSCLHPSEWPVLKCIQ